eukprot:1623173-Rhodomonas_salina.1
MPERWRDGQRRALILLPALIFFTHSNVRVRKEPFRHCRHAVAARESVPYRRHQTGPVRLGRELHGGSGIPNAEGLVLRFRRKWRGKRCCLESAAGDRQSLAGQPARLKHARSHCAAEMNAVGRRRSCCL